MTMKISPKAIAAFALPVLAAIALFLITGEDKWLIGLLAGIVSGGGAVVAPPAPGVKQRELPRLPRRRRSKPINR